MNKWRLFFTVFAVSTFGMLPPGVLNMTMLQTSAISGTENALSFASGAILVEMVYAFATIRLIEWLSLRNQWLLKLELLSMFVLAVFGFYLISTASYRPPTTRITATASGMSFFQGILLSAINPVQIPFWFGWSIVFRSRGWLGHAMGERLIYIGGIGLGSMVGFLPYLWAGLAMWSTVAQHGQLLNHMIGVLLLITAGWQWLTIRKRKDKQAH